MSDNTSRDIGDGQDIVSLYIKLAKMNGSEPPRCHCFDPISIDCKQELPMLPTELWLLICDFVVGGSEDISPGTSLTSKRVYYHLPEPTNPTNTRFSYSSGAESCRCSNCSHRGVCRVCGHAKVYIDAIRQTDSYHYVMGDDPCLVYEKANVRRVKSHMIAVMRLVCKRFARIIARPPPDYYLISKKLYGLNEKLMFGPNNNVAEHMNQAALTILGMLYVFMRLVFETRYIKCGKYKRPQYGWSDVISMNKLKVLSNKPIATRYGSFSVATKGGCLEQIGVETPFGNYTIDHSYGMMSDFAISVDSNLSGNTRGWSTTLNDIVNTLITVSEMSEDERIYLTNEILYHRTRDNG
jgi:hypothetical protein